MSEHVPFITLCLAGKVLHPNEQIHDAIDEWHEGGGFEMKLHQWLGMTMKEYSLWVEKPYALRAILAARHTGSDLHEMMKVTEGGTALAARGVPAEEFAKIRQWLKQSKRL